MVLNDKKENEPELPLSFLLVSIKKKAQHGNGNKPVKSAQKKKRKEGALVTTRKIKGSIPLPMTNLLAQENEEENFEGPIEGSNHSPIPPTKIPTKRKLSKSAIKELQVKRRLEMQE